MSIIANAAMSQLPLGDLVNAAKTGSPDLLKLAGRAIGLGADDR